MRLIQIIILAMLMILLIGSTIVSVMERKPDSFFAGVVFAFFIILLCGIAGVWGN